MASSACSTRRSATSANIEGWCKVKGRSIRSDSRGFAKPAPELVQRRLRLALDDAVAQRTELAEDPPHDVDAEDAPTFAFIDIERHLHLDLRAQHRIAALGVEREMTWGLRGDDLDVEGHREAHEADLLGHAGRVAPVRFHFSRLDTTGHALDHPGHVPQEGPQRGGRCRDGDLTRGPHEDSCGSREGPGRLQHLLGDHLEIVDPGAHLTGKAVNREADLVEPPLAGARERLDAVAGGSVHRPIVERWAETELERHHRRLLPLPPPGP